MKTVPILLVDDSILFRNAIRNILRQNRSFSVVACSGSGLPRRMAKIKHYAVVVIDAVTWIAGLQALRETVQGLSVSAPVILLGREDLVESHSEALRAGAAGFIKQTASDRMLIKAVKAVANGEVWFERALFRRLFVQSTSSEVRRQKTGFTSTEKQIIAFLADGKTNKEIGVYLGLTERTIKSYVSNLFRKTGIPTRSGLAGYAVAHGLAHLTQNPTI